MPIFNVLQVQAAPEGWRTIYLPDDAPGKLNVEPVPAFLLVEEIERQRDGSWKSGDGRRYVVASVHIPDTGELLPAEQISDFWQLLSPTDPLPTPEEIEAEIRSRADRRRS